MMTYISGRNYGKRMDMLVEIARKIDEGLDRVDSGDAEYTIVLHRAGRSVRITLKKEPEGV